MKVQIDTKAKTLKIENDVVLSELVEFLDKILPGEWKSYKLETNTIINWSTPIVIERRSPYYPIWQIPPYEPYYTTCGGGLRTTTGSGTTTVLSRGMATSNMQIESGVYNLEVN